MLSNCTSPVNHGPEEMTFQDKVESSNVRTQAATGYEKGYVPKFQTTIDKNFNNNNCR